MYLTLNLFEASQQPLCCLVRLIVIDQKSINTAYQMEHERDKHGIIYNFKPSTDIYYPVHDTAQLFIQPAFLQFWQTMKLDDKKLRELGLAVIQVEAQAINALAEQINDNFVAACK